MRIFIVEDQQMFADALRVACSRELGCEVVGTAADGQAAIDAIPGATPDLVLLDLDLPVVDGFSVMERVGAIAPAVRFLIISSYCDDRTVLQVERSPASGYIDKGSNSIADLREALAQLRAGGRHFSARFLERQSDLSRNPKTFDKVLSERQQTVLACIGAGWRDAEIADHLGITRHTAEKHRFNIRRRLGLPSAQDLSAYARSLGFSTRRDRTERKTP